MQIVLSLHIVCRPRLHSLSSYPSCEGVSHTICISGVYIKLNHWGQVHVYALVTKLSSVHLNRCWNIVNWTRRNKLQWNFNRNSYIFIQENAFENVVWKMAAVFCLGLNVLKNIMLHKMQRILRIHIPYHLPSINRQIFGGLAPTRRQAIIWSNDG